MFAGVHVHTQVGGTARRRGARGIVEAGLPALCGQGGVAKFVSQTSADLITWISNPRCIGDFV